MDDDLEAAWDELHAATPAGWFEGRPGPRHGGQPYISKLSSIYGLVPTIKRL